MGCDLRRTWTGLRGIELWRCSSRNNARKGTRLVKQERGVESELDDEAQVCLETHAGD